MSGFSDFIRLIKRFVASLENGESLSKKRVQATFAKISALLANFAFFSRLILSFLPNADIAFQPRFCAAMPMLSAIFPVEPQLPTVFTCSKVFIILIISMQNCTLQCKQSMAQLFIAFLKICR